MKPQKYEIIITDDCHAMQRCSLKGDILKIGALYILLYVPEICTYLFLIYAPQKSEYSDIKY